MTANRTIVLMYHAIDEPSAPSENRLCVSPRAFSRQMQWLRQSDYRMVTLDEVVDCLGQGRPMAANAVAVTFDDGFRDIYEHAMPILQANQMPATLFAVTELLGRTNDWMNKKGFPSRGIVTRDELRELATAGMSIGSHTLTHPRMTEIAPEEALREARDSKHQLEDLIGKAVRHFAYPYGLFNEAAKDAVRNAGYSSAASTRSGFNAPDCDLFELRRIDVVGTDSLEQFQRKIEFGSNRVSNGMLLKYYAGRIRARLAM